MKPGNTRPGILLPDLSTSIRRPLFSIPVEAGFPSPAEDYVEGKLDLNKHLIRHPAATFFVRATGESMTGAGIFPGDILVVDRSIEPADKKVVIAVIDGELTVKRLRLKGKRILLVPENEDYPVIEVKEGIDFEIWGVVTAVVHQL